MARRVLSKFRFTTKNLLVLVLGIAIGFALNAWSLQLRLGKARPVASNPGYMIEPDDELRISVSKKRGQKVPPISGKYVVQSDGTVDLQTFGTVEVAGMSVPDAQTAIERALRSKIELPMAMVEVTAKNSRCYYVVVKTPGHGDTITKLKIGSGVTVLSAIQDAGVVVWPTTSQIWIERAPPNGVGAVSLVPVSTGASTSPTAIQDGPLMPGDRLTIATPPEPQ